MSEPMTTPTRPTPPTREDIEATRAMLNTAVMSGRRSTVADILASAELVTRYSRVLDYALDCLTAEQEAETVPADDEGAEVGTPVWREEGGYWCAYIGAPVEGADVLFASPGRWSRWSDGGDANRQDNGSADTLAANVRAASAAWNAAHPELPPVVVPERFRETVPQVEPPEDTSGDGWGPWIDWTGGPRPVAPGVRAWAEFRDGGSDALGRAGDWVWAHDDDGDDIVRYRVRTSDPDAPAKLAAHPRSEGME